MVARCNKLGGDGINVMTECYDGYCYGLCPPKENVTSSTSATTTHSHATSTVLLPEAISIETSTQTDDF